MACLRVLMGRPFGDFLIVMMFTCSVGLLRSEKEVRAHSRNSKAEASPKSLHQNPCYIFIDYMNGTTEFRCLFPNCGRPYQRKGSLRIMW